MSIDKSDWYGVIDVVEAYLTGLHHADIAQLQGVFDESCNLQSVGLRLTRDQWLARVSARPVPEQQGEGFDYQLLSIELLGEQALVKVSCPLLGRHFIDFLSLLKEDGRWRVVNKLYADRPEG